MKDIDLIKEEKINVISFFHKNNGNVRGAYICTRKGSEITLDESFFSRYTIEKDWNPTRGNSGMLEKTNDYKIIEKDTNKVIYSQS